MASGTTALSFIEFATSFYNLLLHPSFPPCFIPPCFTPRFTPPCVIPSLLASSLPSLRHPFPPCFTLRPSLLHPSLLHPFLLHLPSFTPAFPPPLAYAFPPSLLPSCLSLSIPLPVSLYQISLNLFCSLHLRVAPPTVSWKV